ncbi:MAG: MATE family efflux transporter [Planctomycetota bacterium]|jgi:MATE family multidrug resistance protein
MGAEIRVLSRLAWPVVASQAGMMLFGLVDTWMVGRLGARELAAVALADVCLFGSLILGLGLVMGIDPIVAQAHGARDGVRAGRACQRGIVVALLASVPLTLVWLNVDTLLGWLGEEEDLAGLAQVFASAQVFCIAPFLVFATLRQYLHGRGLMLPPLYVICGANVANVFLNWVLIFGHLGFPALGVQGAGLATGLTRTLMMVALAVLVFGGGLHRGAWTPWSAASLRGLSQVLRYGLPVAVQFGLEVWAFSASTVIASRIGVTATAAHIIVLRLASFAFMFPLGISIASATRVGNLLGARDRAGAQRAAWAGLGLGAGVMCISALAFVLVPFYLARFFNPDPEVVALAVTIFPIAAAFQVFDGTQVVGGGILRGMGNPRPAAAFNLIGYYALALPLGWALAFRWGLGLPGIWWGLCVGLCLVAASLVGWIAVRGPAHVARLAIE